MPTTRKQESYTITEMEAYRIECLIQLLGMAIWEILRHELQEPPPDGQKPTCSFIGEYEKEIQAILHLS